MSAEAEQTETTTTTEAETFSATVEAGVLDSYLDCLTAFVDEAKVELAADGLHVEAVDAATVAGVLADLPAGEFESYDAGCGLVGVNIGKLQTAIGLADGSEAIVTLYLNPETRKLDVDGSDFSYSVGLIDPDSVRQSPDRPDLDLSNRVTLGASQFKRAVDGVDNVSDHAAFHVEPDDEALFVVGEGDLDDGEFEFTLDDHLHDFDAEKPSTSLFSHEYLDKVTGKLAGPVDIDTDDQMPIWLTFERNGATVEYMIAPRIRNT